LLVLFWLSFQSLFEIDFGVSPKSPSPNSLLLPAMEACQVVFAVAPMKVPVLKKMMEFEKFHHCFL